MGTDDILEALPDGVVLLRPDGTVAHTNRRARQLLGLPTDPPAVPLTELVSLYEPGGGPCARPFAVPPVASRTAEQLLEVGLPDGRRRPVAVTAARTADGSLVVVVRHAGRRQRTQRSTAELIATVSHEIRSPLASVKGFTRTLLNRWDRLTDEQKRAMLETIDADADRVTRLLTELLDASRIEVGRVDLRLGPVDVGSLIDAVVTRTRARPEASGRTIAVELEGTLPELRADADKLAQVLTNLVDNALRYAPDGPIEVGARAEGGWVSIWVRDHGPGIPPALQARIFDKFGRGPSVRRSGTGLGLYISRGLVRAHGGDIELRSEPGQGATFVVRLPVGGPPTGVDGPLE